MPEAGASPALRTHWPAVLAAVAGGVAVALNVGKVPMALAALRQEFGLSLVQAGASLQARNRWDWGPVHMAAQSGCVPCLDWLKEQGQSLTEPAPANIVIPRDLLPVAG